MLYPGWIGGIRRDLASRRLKGPVLPPFREVKRGSRKRSDCGVRDRCPSPDPLLQKDNLVGRELATGRHLQRVILMPDGLNKPALLRLARHGHRAAVSSFEDTRPAV